MVKKRPRRSKPRYPQEQLPDPISLWQLSGPWKTREERARALMALLPSDPDRQRECETDLEEAERLGINEDRLCAALYAGLVEHYWEQVRSQRALIHQELEIRVRRLRRDLPLLLKELWLIAEDEEARDLTTRLMLWMKHADWIDFSRKGRRARAGNPLQTVLRRTRDRLKAAGVKNYDQQTEWLKDVGLIQERPRPDPAIARLGVSLAAPLPPPRAVPVRFAPWLQDMLETRVPPVPTTPVPPPENTRTK